MNLQEILMRYAAATAALIAFVPGIAAAESPLCALLKREPPQQAATFMKQYGLNCDP
jgi:hypothetical protein